MQVTERIWLVGSGMHGFGLTHPSDCHVWLVDGGSEAALIDAASGVDTAAILARIDRTPIPRERITKLFVTHAPKLAGGDGPGLVTGLAELERPLELAWLLEEDGELFARYRMIR